MILQVTLSDKHYCLAVCQTDPGAACGGGDKALRGWGAGEPGGVAGRANDAQEDHRTRC